MKQNSNYPPEVLEIHQEMYTASDKLYSEAEALLAKEINDDKVKRLKKLGFSNAGEVKEITNLQRSKQSAQSNMDTILKYRRKYPLNKVVDEGTIQRVCEKYGLVMGKIFQFTGFVPESKLTEIENFQIEKEDKGYEILIRGSFVSGPRRITYDEHINVIRQNVEAEAQANRYMNDPSRIVSSAMYFTPPITYAAPQQIMAPVKDMKFEGHHLEGHKLVQNQAPDPIVLQPLSEEGFYMIVTAWGPEASDPEVVNEINN